MYEVWDDKAGTQLRPAMPEAEAKAFALAEDPGSERLFLEDEAGNQLAWNPFLKQWDEI